MVVDDWKLWQRNQYGSPIVLFETITSNCDSLSNILQFEISSSCLNSNCDRKVRTRNVDQLVLHRQQLERCGSFKDLANGYMLNGHMCTCRELLYSKINVLPTKALMISVDPGVDQNLEITFQPKISIHGFSWSLIARVNSLTPSGDHFTTQISDMNGVIWDHDPMKSGGQMLNLKNQIEATGKRTYFLCYWRD